MLFVFGANPHTFHLSCIAVTLLVAVQFIVMNPFALLWTTLSILFCMYLSEREDVYSTTTK